MQVLRKSSVNSRRYAFRKAKHEALHRCERLMLYRLGNVPRKKYRLAITTLRTPDARSAQSNNVIVGFRFNAPTLRCRCVVTPRLVANKDFVTAPSLRPRRGFAALAKCFRLGTASPPATLGQMSLQDNTSPPTAIPILKIRFISPF